MDEKIELLIDVLSFLEWRFGSYTKEKGISNFMRGAFEQRNKFVIDLTVLFYLSDEFPIYRIINKEDIPAKYISEGNLVLKANSINFEVTWIRGV